MRDFCSKFDLVVDPVSTGSELSSIPRTVLVNAILAKCEDEASLSDFVEKILPSFFEPKILKMLEFRQLRLSRAAEHTHRLLQANEECLGLIY